jgi:hypothetical protein
MIYILIKFLQLSKCNFAWNYYAFFVYLTWTFMYVIQKYFFINLNIKNIEYV